MNLKLPARSATGHKGTFGSLAIIGGQINDDRVMLGSAVFAAKAAIRSGVGLVYFVGQKELLVELIKMVPQAVGQKLDDVKADAAVVGPGLGQSEASISMLEKVLALDLPTVIDADGLNILAKKPGLGSHLNNKCLLTPHPGEFERLAKTFDIKTAGELARKLGCGVVLKDHETAVSDGQKTWTNSSANPALATGGTGDVLSGLIGGLLAQHFPKLSVYDSACLGVQIHSQAGLAWKQKHGSGGLIIEELIDLIPETMEKPRA